MSKGPRNILVTGANRGIGLELVKQLLVKYKPENIIATYRDAASTTELKAIAEKNSAVHLIQLDIRDDAEKLREAAAQVDQITKGNGINLLINNAGVWYKQGGTLQELEKQTLLNFLEVNTFGAIFMTQAFEFLLEKGSKSVDSSVPLGVGRAVLVNSASRLGSIADNSSGGSYASRVSRGALNAATKSLSIDLFPKKIVTVLMDPGWVKTDQGGADALITTEESVQGIVKVIDSLTEASNGQFLRYNGETLPW